MTTLRRGDQYRSRAYRGVQWLKFVSLVENAGTVSVPVVGDPLDLTEWPTVVLAAHPEGLDGNDYAIRGAVSYEFMSPARLMLRIESAELSRAVVDTPSGVELRPIRVTVVAVNNSGGQRVLLSGVLDLLPSGFTG